MIVSAAVALVTAQGGFDTSQANTSTANVLGWIDEAVQSAVADTQWLKQVRELGPTVEDEQQYLIDSDIVQVKRLRVNGSKPWVPTELGTLWELEAGSGFVANAPGAFAEGSDSEDAQDTSNVQKWVRLWPAPTTAGYSIEGFCAVEHPEITTSDSTPIQLPNDLVRQIAVDGAINLGLLYAHSRGDLAAPFASSYAAAVKSLEKRAKSRIGGPRQARVGR
jgi:hypothetical protein